MSDEELSRKIAENWPSNFGNHNCPICGSRHDEDFCPWIKRGVPRDFVNDRAMTVMLMEKLLLDGKLEYFLSEMRASEPSWINDRVGYSKKLRRIVTVSFAKANNL